MVFSFARIARRGGMPAPGFVQARGLVASGARICHAIRATIAPVVLGWSGQFHFASVLADNDAKVWRKEYDLPARGRRQFFCVIVEGLLRCRGRARLGL